MNASIAILIVFTIAGGLALDQWGGAWGQVSVNVWAWAVFVVLLKSSIPSRRLPFIACLLIATIGELVLSLGWGLYDYRLGNLPLFVPPGHVLLYALGLWIAERLPERFFVVLPACVGISALALAGLGYDLLSLPLTGLFLLAFVYGPAPKLYATMFVLALLMELWGTALGNWAWRSHVPGLSWPTLNPPFAAGAFYCVLDWLVGVSIAKRQAIYASQEP